MFLSYSIWICLKAFQGWVEIAKVQVRSSKFEESEDEQIDIFDVKVILLKFILNSYFVWDRGTDTRVHFTV